MKYYYLEPEVAGGIGKHTIMDTSTHPPIISKLNYEFDGWSGDELLESFPCFIVTEHLSELLSQNSFTGFTLHDVEISKSDEFEELYPNQTLPKFVWLKITGEAGTDDFGIAKDHRLVVSQIVLENIKPFCANLLQNTSLF